MYRIELWNNRISDCQPAAKMGEVKHALRSLAIELAVPWLKQASSCRHGVLFDHKGKRIGSVTIDEKDRICTELYREG